MSSAIKLSRAGLKQEGKPVGCFLFAGPTGVGKTEVSRQLARTLGIELVRFDMSEYMERHTVSRLIGAPPGYVGFDQGGLLTEAITKNPHCVLLLDEVEKAHPDVFNMLLQVLDDGFLTDSLGRKINFQNTIIIMTSNIGARQVKDFGSGVGFETSNMKSQASDIEKSVIQNALKKTFAPEFLNRIDDVVIFNTLEKEDIEQIFNIELIKLTKRVEKLGYGISLTKAAKAFISDKGFDKKYGARPLNRAIQKYIEDLLAENVVNNNIEEGTHITLDHKKGDEELHIKSATEVKEK